MHSHKRLGRRTFLGTVLVGIPDPQLLEVWGRVWADLLYLLGLPKIEEVNRIHTTSILLQFPELRINRQLLYSFGFFTADHGT